MLGKAYGLRHPALYRRQPSMQRRVKLAVGSRGEIYTTKEIRRAVGIEPRRNVLAEVVEGRLVLKPEETATTLLEREELKVPPISPARLSKFRRRLSKRLEGR